MVVDQLFNWFVTIIKDFINPFKFFNSANPHLSQFFKNLIIIIIIIIIMLIKIKEVPNIVYLILARHIQYSQVNQIIRHLD